MLRLFSAKQDRIIQFRNYVTCFSNFSIWSLNFQNARRMKENISSGTVIIEDANYKIRNIVEEDISAILEIRKSLGIHDCYSCMKTWHKLDPEGILIVEDKYGQIVGAVSHTPNSEEVITTGIYFMKPELRNTGIAKKLFQIGFEKWRNKIVSGQCVFTMTKYYEDFTSAITRDNYTVVRNISPTNVDYNILSDNLPDGVVIQPFQEHHLPLMWAYDFSLLGYNREHFLELNCKEENSKTFVALNNGKCVGFGTIKLSCLGAGRVGPLYADDAFVAEALLKTLLRSFPQGKGFVMVTLSNNLMANLLVKKLKVPTTQHLAQMFRKSIIDVDTEKVYAHFDVNSAPF